MINTLLRLSMLLVFMLMSQVKTSLKRKYATIGKGNISSLGVPLVSNVSRLLVPQSKPRSCG